MRELSVKTNLYGQQNLSKSRSPSYLGRFYRTRRRREAFAGRQGDIHDAGANYRKGVCRREGKALHEIHTLPGISKTTNANSADIRRNELEKDSKLEA